MRSLGRVLEHLWTLSNCRQCICRWAHIHVSSGRRLSFFSGVCMITWYKGTCEGHCGGHKAPSRRFPFNSDLPPNCRECGQKQNPAVTLIAKNSTTFSGTQNIVAEPGTNKHQPFLLDVGHSDVVLPPETPGLMQALLYLPQRSPPTPTPSQVLIPSKRLTPYTFCFWRMLPWKEKKNKKNIRWDESSPTNVGVVIMVKCSRKFKVRSDLAQ